MHESCVSYLVDTNIKKKHCFQEKITGPLVRVDICRGCRDFFPGRVTFLENNAKFYVLPE